MRSKDKRERRAARRTPLAGIAQALTGRKIMLTDEECKKNPMGWVAYSVDGGLEGCWTRVTKPDVTVRWHSGKNETGTTLVQHYPAEMFEFTKFGEIMRYR